MHMKQVARRNVPRDREGAESWQAPQELISSEGHPSGGGEGWVKIHQVSQLEWS